MGVIFRPQEGTENFLALASADCQGGFAMFTAAGSRLSEPKFVDER